MIETRNTSQSKRRWIAVVVILGLVAVATASAFALGGDDVGFENPDYRIVDTFGEIEVREYPPYIVAETVVDGDLESAGNTAFSTLARYITGENRPSQEIAMTAPVNQERREIAMTVPVTQSARRERFAVQFIMPSEYKLDELPVPTDDRIEIREVPARRVAAIRYTGRYTKKNYDKHLASLLEELRVRGYEPLGEPVWARYDPPFRPWFMRRIEILSEFRPLGSAAESAPGGDPPLR